MRSRVLSASRFRSSPDGERRGFDCSGIPAPYTGQSPVYLNQTCG
jgi:hypothetical protein